MNDSLAKLLDRSELLLETILGNLDDAEFDSTSRGESIFRMCSVSLEHGASIRILVASTHPASIVGLLRMQFEAQTRAMWLLYAASDAAVSKLAAPLNARSQQAAKSLPSVSEMMNQIGKQVGTNAPAAAYHMLVSFKNVSWDAMNSFVHAGIHPLRRHAEGYPLIMVEQVVRNSNALSTMAGMTLALLTGDPEITRSLSQVQQGFADCLPELLAQ